MKCPVCGAKEFFVKDPEDAFSSFEFEIIGGQVVFADAGQAEETPEISEATETYCTGCTWHDRMEKLK